MKVKLPSLFPNNGYLIRLNVKSRTPLMLLLSTVFVFGDGEERVGLESGTNPQSSHVFLSMCKRVSSEIAESEL